MRLLLFMLRGFKALLKAEYRRGTLRETLKLSRQAKTLKFSRDLTHAELLEEKAARNKDRTFLFFKDQTISYAQMDTNASRVGNFLLKLGAKPGEGIAIMMKNSPRWLDLFFGSQKVGMFSVPVNIALRGDSLAYIFNNSGARYLFIDHDLLEFYQRVEGEIDIPPRIIVNQENAPPDYRIPEGMLSLEEVYSESTDTRRPEVEYRPDDPYMILYTSGTTGRPKGVVTRYKRTGIKALSMLAGASLKRSDIYYTCLPLFHANALLLTVTVAMAADARVALSERFSARNFWDEVRQYNVTVFNTIGAIIPILLKQPERPEDRKNRVRYVMSAACPADMWERFEKRFGVKLHEGYGAIDGGGFITMNLGNAPVGSIGKPLFGNYRLVDENMQDVPQGQPGQLICWVGKKKEESTVEYYRDDKSTGEKLKDGWLRTGDLMYRDKKGNLYFVGRVTESMRRRGENVSAYEVEQAILKHPDIIECAVYAVPSELAEDDIMTSVVPLEGKTVDPKELIGFLQDKLARFAIPRYVRIVDSLPKTETERVIKKLLEKDGVTGDTYDAEK
ncbi:MAG: AMP-binding protein [Deltaproteobacteria bacterium]|nr:MAG: AMP-binding protein [Deltaproteobacteria bacterium]